MTEVLIGIVLDTTLSFSSVYAQVYYCLEQMLMNIHRAKRENKEIIVKYSVTLLNDHPKTVMFENDRFSPDETAVLKELAKVSFHGGMKNGREMVTQAISLGYRELCNHQVMDEAKVRRALIVLTDSAPSDGMNYPDFTGENVCGSGQNKGLQYGMVYSYSEDYMPVFKVVNSAGKLTENGRNTCLYGNLADLLKADECETIDEMKKLTDDMLSVLFE